MPKSLFESFCAEVGVSPHVVEAEVSSTHEGRLHNLETPENDEDIVGAREDEYAKGCGSIAGFRLVRRGWQEDKLDYRGDCQTVISAILREHESVKAPEDPDCHVFVRDGDRILILKSPYYSGSTSNVERVRKLVKKYKHISCRIGRDAIIRMGFKPGLSPFSSYKCDHMTIHDAKAPDLICTGDMINRAAHLLGDVLAKKLGPVGKKVCWFSGFPKPRKVDYAAFVIDGLKLCKKLGANADGVLELISSFPYKSLAKDKEEVLRDFGKLVVSAKRKVKRRAR